jgi:hypothetical protein
MVPIGERSSTFPNDREPDSHDDDDEPIHHSVVLEHNGSLDSIPPEFLRSLLATCLMQPTYLDHFYVVQPGRPNEAKRIVGFYHAIFGRDATRIGSPMSVRSSPLLVRISLCRSVRPNRS